jgi:hypothetical protein
MADVKTVLVRVSLTGEGENLGEAKILELLGTTDSHVRLHKIPGSEGEAYDRQLDFMESGWGVAVRLKTGDKVTLLREGRLFEISALSEDSLFLDEFFEILAGVGFFAGNNILDGTSNDNFASPVATFGTHVDNPV